VALAPGKIWIIVVKIQLGLRFQSACLDMQSASVKQAEWEIRSAVVVSRLRACLELIRESGGSAFA
jgi:hypothetical protein